MIGRLRTGLSCWLGNDRYRSFLLLALVITIVLTVSGTPAAAGGTVHNLSLRNMSGPAILEVGVFVMDFNRFNVDDGTVETNFYLDLRSDSPVSLDDIEIINGKISSVDTLIDTPDEKYYRIFAVITADPSLRNFPFDSHAIPIVIEPKVMDETSLLLAVNSNQSGLDNGADLPGWEFTGNESAVTRYSYGPGETPYSRAVFTYHIQRDSASTILKFFLPLALIIIVSLSSLLMKVSSRLGLNASMFLAAVLIHWRIVDAIPPVAYVTFLDYFMIITYATLFMVLVSGILIIHFSELKASERVDQIHRWSIRIIPIISATLYLLLVLTLFL